MMVRSENTLSDIHELFGMALHNQNPDAHDVLVELVGLLAQLVFPNVSYADLIVQHGLVEFCLKHLMPGFAEDDLVLEIIIMLGTLAADPQAAPMLANHRLIHCLHDVLLEKSDDDEIVLQIVFTLFKFLLHRETREVIMQNEGLVVALLELLQASNPVIRHTVNDALEVIVECGEIYHEQVVEKRFEHHNREWLQLMHEMAVAGLPHHMMGRPQSMMQHMHPELAAHLGQDGAEYYAHEMRQLQMQQHGGGDSPNLASSWDKGKFDED